MEITISHKKPSNETDWNTLCIANGNFQQSTFGSTVNSFYGENPIYLEVYNNQQLVGGVKLNFWRSTKSFLTKRISSALFQNGEIIFNNEENREKLIQVLNDATKNILKEYKVVKFTTTSTYGHSELLMNGGLKPTTQSKFFTGYVDINKDDTELLASYNRNTRRNIKTASASDLTYKENPTIEEFLVVEKVVYDQQPGIDPPNFDFIRHMHKSLGSEFIKLGIVSDSNEILAGGLINVLGKNAYSSFGGARRNEKGAGHYFYYHLMMKLRDSGVERFYFGQIASPENPVNDKFFTGISNFKKGFNCVEVESTKNYYIISPLYNRLWNLLLKVLKKN